MPLTPIVRESLPKYQFVQPALPDSMASSLAALVSYNGIVLNDRLRPDRYVLTGIDGLGSPDIRDNRQARPGDHGEVPYDAFFGGRTVTFEGTIESWSFQQLQKMERDLAAAVSSLTELPLKLNWYDWHDEFSEALSSAFYTATAGGPLVVKGDGSAQFTTPTNGSAYLNFRQFVNERVMVRLACGAPNGTAAMSVFCSAAATNQLLQGTFQVIAGTPTLVLSAVTPTGTTVLASTAAAPLSNAGFLYAGVQLWLVLYTIDDVVTLAVYTQDPVLNPSVTPATSVSVTLSGALANLLGYGQQGYVGLMSSGTDAGSWLFQDFRIDGIYPSDVQLNARAVGNGYMTKKGYQAGVDRYRQDFQFSLRASNPRFVAPLKVTGAVPLFSSSGVSFGRTYPRTYTLTYGVPINALGVPINQGQAQRQLVVNNRGNGPAQPVVVIYGGITSPQILNVTTGQYILLDGTIASSDYIVLDAAARTVVNSAGLSQFSLFDPLSSWITLQPGDNTLILTGTSSVGSPYATVTYGHTWMAL